MAVRTQPFTTELIRA